MKLEVNYRNGHYYWVLFDGPEGIDMVEGYSDSLGQAFEQIIQKRYENALNYSHESH